MPYQLLGGNPEQGALQIGDHLGIISGSSLQSKMEIWNYLPSQGYQYWGAVTGLGQLKIEIYNF